MSSQGALAKMAFDAVLPFDTSSEAFEFVSENVQMLQTHAKSNGIRGTRSRNAARTRIASEKVSGSIQMNPSVTEIDRLLPRILGGATSGGVTALAETLPEFQLMIDRIAKVFTYAGCFFSRATISGSPGAPIGFALDVEGKTESVGNSGTFPAISIDTQSMFVFSDLTLDLGGTDREISSFSLVIDNVLDTERFMNSLTRNSIPATDRIVTLDVTVPYTTTNTDLHDLAIAGIDAVLEMSDGTTTYTFDFGNLKAEAKSPVVGGRNEIVLPITFTCEQTGSTKELVVTKT